MANRPFHVASLRSCNARHGMRAVVCLGLVLLASSTTASQSENGWVLPDATLQLVANEVNGYAAFNNLRRIATYHRMNGSELTAEILRTLEAKVKQYGIEDVRIHRVPVRTGYEYFGLQHFDGMTPMRGHRAEVRLVEPFPKLITTTESAPSSLIYGSRSADVTAPVVFVGQGADPASYEGKDLRGKLALAGNAWPNDVKELAIHRHGAAGVLFFLDIPHNSGDNDDANLNFWWSPWSDDGEESTFGISLSNNQYRYLRSLLEGGEEVVVRVKVEADLQPEEDSVFETLDAAIVGSEYADEEFMMWAHIDHSMPGAVDNGSGCAMILEVARTLQALIDNGVIQPPRRTIRFLWLPHVTGMNMYLSTHPDKIGKVRGGISVDSVGIDPRAWSSYFAPAKPSHALPSYWTAVLEDLVEHLDHRANRSTLDYGDLDNLFAPEGSRQQLHVRIRPYDGGGDEMQTNDGTVGIPTMAFGNVPVPPRHSQVNFLSYVDPTGLHRSAYLAAALAMVFGWADEDGVARIVDEVYERARVHLTRESNQAITALHWASADELPNYHARGQHLLEYGGQRELAALSSVAPLMPDAAALTARIERRRDQIARMVGGLRSELRNEYEIRSAELGVPVVEPSPTAEEAALDGLVPTPAPGVLGKSSYFGDYYAKVLGAEALAAYELDPDFSYGHVGYNEAHNFIDGRRSILEIYRATAAELWSEGYPERHGIELAEVARYMRMLEAAGIVTIEQRR